MEHSTLAFPTAGLHDTQGRRTGSSWLLQRGARVDFSQGMLPSGGPHEPAELSTYITREDEGPGLTWPSFRNGPPSLHLCFVLFLFSSSHKLGDVNTQQELWPMIIIFPQ